MKAKLEFDKLKDDVHYLIVAHCKYKDMLMYDRALKQFQEDINYGQLQEMSYDERFAFLLGFETSLKAIKDAITLSEQLKENSSFTETLNNIKRNIYMLNEFGQINEIFPGNSHGHAAWVKAVQQNNSFKTIEDAEKERDRRALLYEFNQFKDKCNKEKEIEFNSLAYKERFCICIIYNELDYIGTEKGTFFPLFGYFYDREHCLEAIKKFGDRIKRLYVD